MPASYPWDLFNVVPHLFTRQKKERRERLKRERFEWRGDCKRGNIIKSGAYIEAASISVGIVLSDRTVLSVPDVIEDDCRVGQAVEIKNSLLGKGTYASHLTYIGDSIIGENCNSERDDYRQFEARRRNY
jgi:bifunctional UDP-N-acetylglucosamine pyrophosphorylase/glucosamine-1-phosphate N-acetyltransferase